MPEMDLVIPFGLLFFNFWVLRHSHEIFWVHENGEMISRNSSSLPYISICARQCEMELNDTAENFLPFLLPLLLFCLSFLFFICLRLHLFFFWGGTLCGPLCPRTKKKSFYTDFYGWVGVAIHKNGTELNTHGFSPPAQVSLKLLS